MNVFNEISEIVLQKYIVLKFQKSSESYSFDK